MFWLLGLLTRNPERLLSLLIKAHDLDQEQWSVSATFRAGMRVGLDHPETARRALELPLDKDRF